MKKTVLVTGGCGFIGSNFVRYLYNKYPDYRIIVVDNLTYAGNIANAPHGAFETDRYEFWYGNVCNSELMGALVSKSDIVVHMAAESHVTRSIYDNKLFFETDVLGTQAVINAVLKNRSRIERFLHISTSEVYGTALKDKIDEEHPLNPMSPYASAKCGADRLVYSYWCTYDVPAVIIRPFNNYGPYQHLEKAVPRFVTSCILKEPLTVHGDGTAARDWLYVEDHCEALDLIMHADLNLVAGQVINVGTGIHRSVLEMAEAIRSVMNTKSEIKFIGNRPGQVFRHTSDSSKAEKLLNWKPKTSLLDGLKKTVDFYDTHSKWWHSQLWMRHIPIISAAGIKELH